MTTGLLAFVAARDSVTSNRQKALKERIEVKRSLKTKGEEAESSTK